MAKREAEAGRECHPTGARGGAVGGAEGARAGQGGPRRSPAAACPPIRRRISAGSSRWNRCWSERKLVFPDSSRQTTSPSTIAGPERGGGRPAARPGDAACRRERTDPARTGRPARGGGAKSLGDLGEPGLLRLAVAAEEGQVSAVEAGED